MRLNKQKPMLPVE